MEAGRRPFIAHTGSWWGHDRHADHRRRERGRGARGAPPVRGDRDLPDHALLPDGRARRRAVGLRSAEPVGRGPAGDRDAERGGRRGRPARSPAGGRALHHLHGVAGSPADDPEHVQDRRRADARGDPRGRADTRDARTVDLRRPERRDGGAPDGVGDARLVRRPGRPGPRGRDARGHARVAGAVPALLRRVPDLPRGERDPGAARRGAARPDGRPSRAGTPRARPVPRPPRAPRQRSEPRRLLPGPRGLEPVPPGRAAGRPVDDGSVRRAHWARTTCSTTTVPPTPSAWSC